MQLQQNPESSAAVSIGAVCMMSICLTEAGIVW